MSDYTKSKVIELGTYIANTGDSIKDAAKELYLSYVTAYNYFCKLEEIDNKLYKKARAKQRKNKRKKANKNMSAKKVVQLDYYTDEVIEVYSSIGEAAEDNWMDRDDLSKILRIQNGLSHVRKLKFAYAE